jgi:hypothetical protein
MGRGDYWTLALLVFLVALFLYLRLALGVGALIPGRL